MSNAEIRQNQPELSLFLMAKKLYKEGLTIEID